MSQQDDTYKAEYAEYSARRAAEGLPIVSYRNYLRQWKRSEEGHVGRGEPRLEKAGRGGTGGVSPPPPPPKWREDGTEGGGAPPAVKAKGGETLPGSLDSSGCTATGSTRKRVGGRSDLGKSRIPRIP